MSIPSEFQILLSRAEIPSEQPIRRGGRRSGLLTTLTPTDNRLVLSELSVDRDDPSQQQLDFGAVIGRDFDFVMRSNNFVR